MERIHKIWEHPLYQEQFRLLQAAEADRRFCRHTLEHFLDVARIAYIASLESGAPLSREIIYAAALLHDIGRYAQLSQGIPHEEAGADFAGKIMADCDFSREEISQVQEAIRSHRGSRPGTAGTELAQYLYRADKQSRCCFACPAAAECNWSPEKKNLRILF
ncbi:MAG: HD domain-containing protein [Lachnospiraceae bacterium]|nr:HD domain-containing protein [Lachnospiraceae bacterium]